MSIRNIMVFLGINLTKDEKIEKVKKYYKDDPRRMASAIFKLEGLDEVKDPEEYYEKLVRICAKHSLNYEIPN